MIKLGNNNIGKIYLGSNAIGKAYLGSNLVYQAGSGPTPSPYTLVDYIETDGVAYIDTGKKGNVPQSAEIYVTPVIPASGTNYIMGVRKDTGNTRLVNLLIGTDGNAGYAYAGNIISGTGGINCSSSATNKTLMLVRSSFSTGSQSFGIKQAGQSSFTTKTGTNSTSITGNNYNVCIFAIDSYGNIAHATSGVRVQYVKLWGSSDYSGDPIFYGVACQYNGEYGLWDYVSNSFFGNAAGSGSFTGPSIQ